MLGWDFRSLKRGFIAPAELGRTGCFFFLFNGARVRPVCGREGKRGWEGKG